jgi:hypothetical protein
MTIDLSAGSSTIAASMAADRAVDGPTVVASPAVRETLLIEPDFSRMGRRCERAVVTAYRDLRAHGSGDFSAFQACTTLYRIHHPDASISEARRLVAEWIDHHLLRGAPGETPGCDCD